MTARSTAARYASDHGPIVFGAAGVLVRWNRLTAALVVELEPPHDGASLVLQGELAERVLVELWRAQQGGRLLPRLRSLLEPVRGHDPEAGDWYRCGRMMCHRPAWQAHA